MPEAKDLTQPFRDTPLDPRFKKGFYLDQTGIVGRVRARTESIPNKGVDFLSLNERGDLVVALPREFMELFEGMNKKLDTVIEELQRIR